MLKRGNSKGLSRAATIFLVVFVVLLATAFFVVKNLVSKEGQIKTFGKYTLDLRITHVQIAPNNSLIVIVKRNIGRGNFIGIDFVLEDGEIKETIRTNVSLEELESQTFVLNFLEANVSKANKISIGPVFALKTREEIFGGIKDEYIFGSQDTEVLICIIYCPPEAECGNDGCGGVCGGGCPSKDFICLEYKCLPTLKAKCADAKIRVENVSNISTNFSIVFSREEGVYDIGGIKMVFMDEIETSNFITNLQENIAPFENVTKYITIPGMYLENPEKLQIIVYFLDESGNRQFCQSSEQFFF